MLTLVAIGYPDQRTAGQAWSTVRHSEDELIVQADQVAVVSRDPAGNYHVHTRTRGSRPRAARCGADSGACWVALDRAAQLAHIRGEAELAASWAHEGAELKSDILENGVDKRGVRRRHYETDALDASTLLAAIFGFLTSPWWRPPHVSSLQSGWRRSQDELRRYVEISLSVAEKRPDRLSLASAA